MTRPAGCFRDGAHITRAADGVIELHDAEGLLARFHAEGFGSGILLAFPIGPQAPYLTHVRDLTDAGERTDLAQDMLHCFTVGVVAPDLTLTNYRALLRWLASLSLGYGIMVAQASEGGAA